MTLLVRPIMMAWLGLRTLRWFVPLYFIILVPLLVELFRKLYLLYSNYQSDSTSPSSQLFHSSYSSVRPIILHFEHPPIEPVNDINDSPPPPPHPAPRPPPPHPAAVISHGDRKCLSQWSAPWFTQSRGASGGHDKLFCALYRYREGGHSCRKNGSDWPQMGQIWDFLRSVSVHFGSVSQYVLSLIQIRLA